jgi:hypothetical protein
MSIKHRIWSRFACACLAWSGLAACSHPHTPPASVDDLMDDRVALDGLLMKCNANPQMSLKDPDCETARTASVRLAVQNERVDVDKRQEEFEHSRDALRQAQERLRAAEESASKVDAYHLPVLPVDSPATPPSDAQQAAGVGQAKP